MKFTSTDKILVQGIAEPLGRFYTRQMLAYGTQVVAGVSVGRGGEQIESVPVFDMVEQALATLSTRKSSHGIDATVIFLPPYQVLDAALEAIAAGIRRIIIITGGVPPLDMVRLIRKAEATETLVVGPTCPGLIIPDQILIGTHPPDYYAAGAIGMISRSGTLTYEVAGELTRAGFGQSIVVGIGGDRIVGSSLQQWLQMLEEDETTKIIVMVGEVGGDSEEAAAHYISEAIDKPVVAYIAGRMAPQQQLIGHTGTILSTYVTDLREQVGTVERKVTALQEAHVHIANRPSDIPKLVQELL